MSKSIKIQASWETIYLILFSLYSFFSVVDSSLLSVGAIMKITKIGCSIGLVFIYLSRQKVQVKKLIPIFILLIAFFSAAYSTDRNYIFVACLFILCSDVTNFKNAASVALVSSFSATCLVILAAKAGVVQDLLFIREHDIAHSLGFGYYSTYPYILMFNMLAYMYIRKNLSLIEIALLVLANMYIYRMSTLRLSFYLTIFILVLYLFLVKGKMLDLNNKLIRRGAILVYPLMFALSIYTSFAYKPYHRSWRELNEMLSGRLGLQQQAFQLYKIRIFGQMIESHSMVNGKVVLTNYFYLDSGFIYALLGYGLLFTLVLISVYSFLLYNSCCKNDKKMAIWLVTLAIFTVINNVWVSLYYNCALLLFMQVFNKRLLLKHWYRVLEKFRYGIKTKL